MKDEGKAEGHATALSSFILPPSSLLFERGLAVEAHDLKGHLGGGVHVFYVEPFLDGVDGAHSGAEIGALDAFPVEDVRVAAAARSHRLDLEAHARGGLLDEPDDA